jgi:membrane protein DedA with SNARE-associated domain
MAQEESDGTAMELPVVESRTGYAVTATIAIAALVVILLVTGLLEIPPGTAETAIDLLEQYGLLALFGAFLLEGAMLLFFAPSESLVPAAVLFLADTPVDIAVIIGVAVVGATIGQVALFVVAKRGGRAVVHERRWINISEDRLDRFDAWFDRWGPIVVPVSNTMLFTRGMVTVPAGVAGMDTRRFALLSALGTLSFEIILAGIAVYAPDVLSTVV